MMIAKQKLIERKADKLIISVESSCLKSGYG